MRFTSTLCALALITPMTAFSQNATSEANQVDAGSRVRIAAPMFGDKKQVGTVVSVSRDTLVLRQGASTTHRSVATSDITALEVSKGTYTRKGKGALWGLMIGAGVGAVAGYVSYTEPKPCTNFCISMDLGPSSKGSSAAFGGLAGGIVGALFGTFFGRNATDAWEPATVGTK